MSQRFSLLSLNLWRVVVVVRTIIFMTNLTLVMLGWIGVKIGGWQLNSKFTSWPCLYMGFFLFNSYFSNYKLSSLENSLHAWYWWAVYPICSSKLCVSLAWFPSILSTLRLVFILKWRRVSYRRVYLVRDNDLYSWTTEQCSDNSHTGGLSPWRSSSPPWPSWPSWPRPLWPARAMRDIRWRK